MGDVCPQQRWTATGQKCRIADYQNNEYQNAEKSITNKVMDSDAHESGLAKRHLFPGGPVPNHVCCRYLSSGASGSEIAHLKSNI